MKVLLAFVIFTLSATHLFSQTPVSGKVTDKKGMPVIGANISIKGSYDGASSDERGEFSFTTSEKDSQVLSVSYIGFETAEQKIFCSGKPLHYTIILKETVNELNAVVISAGTFEASDAKRVTILRPLDIVTTAGSRGDTYAALQTLPGTQAGSNETGLLVRGGDASETKTFIDGVAVANPYFNDVPDIPQRGRFSPFLFKGTIFSTGGYSAQYGGAMSGAVILESQDLPEQNTTSISIMSVGAALSHEQLLNKKQTSVGVTASYVNLAPYFLLAKQHYDYEKAPESGGASVIFRQKTSKTGIFKAFVNWAPTALEVTYPYAQDSSLGDFNFRMKSVDFFSQASYKELIAGQWTLFTDFSYSHNNSKILLNHLDSLSQLTSLTQGRVTLSRPIGSLSSIRFGGELFHPQDEDDFDLLKQQSNDTYSAGYVEGDIYLTPKLVARIGARAEHSALLSKSNLAPRASIAYKTGEFSQVSFAYGQFYQQPDREFLYSHDPLNFSHANHYILNYQVVGNNRTFRIEGYYKQYHDLIKTVPDTASNGDGYASGFDFFYRDKKTIRHADFWISYSFLNSKRDYLYFPGPAVPSFAAKHTLNVVYKQYLRKINSSVSATYAFSTGRNYLNPFNPVLPGEKLPDYNNLSINFSYLTSIFQNFTVVACGVENVFGFNNIIGYRYIDSDEPVEVEQPALRSFFIGLFMTIGADKGDDE